MRVVGHQIDGKDILAADSRGKTAPPHLVSTRRNLGRGGHLRGMDAFRESLADARALPQLALLGIAAGAVTSVAVGALFALIGFAGDAVASLAGGDFQRLSPMKRAALPLAGAAVLAVVLTPLAARRRRAGVAHVLERLAQRRVRFPLANAAVQCFGGAAALGAGLSGGAEGPAAHLGAASSSSLGNALKIPQNSVRVLVACGAAAALASSFNTPMAGVIFALEVVLMEYTAATFIPVLLAAATANIVGHWTFGQAEALAMPDLTMHSYMDLPFVMLAGVVIGALAAVFVAALRGFARLDGQPFWFRAGLAGAITGAAALASPAVMGMGYDSVHLALLGQIAWPALLIIVVAKTVASTACVGLGLPVGVIAPTLVIGAAAGELLSFAGAAWAPAGASAPGFYAMLGMAAMAGAALHAPLTALLIVLELTSNLHVILPAMLIVAVATVTSRHVLRQPSAFAVPLRRLGISHPPTAPEQHLLRTAVARLMEKRFAVLPRGGGTPLGTATWVIADRGNAPRLLRARDFPPEGADSSLASGEPAHFIDYRATLLEAQERLDQTGAQALCVHGGQAEGLAGVVGVLERATLDAWAAGRRPGAADAAPNTRASGAQRRGED